MAHLDPRRPNEDEYPPLLGGHVRRVPEGAILAILDAQMATTERVLAAYTSAHAAWRPADGEWNAVEITGHLADIERVHAFRALSVARGHTAPLPGMNPIVYMERAQFAQRPLADVAAEFFAVRGATMAFFRSLDAAAWARTGSVLDAPAACAPSPTSSRGTISCTSRTWSGILTWRRGERRSADDATG
jgi:DinB superfamily